MVHRAVLVLFGVVGLLWSCAPEPPNDTPQTVEKTAADEPVQTGQLVAPLPDDPVPCEGPGDEVCDDDDVCIIDACIDQICRHGQVPNFAACCNFGKPGANAKCDDDNPCTDDSCGPDNTCVNVANGLPNCCATHAACGVGGPWDDGIPSTIDYCLNYQCQHLIQGCFCDCPEPEFPGPEQQCMDDGNPCTETYCKDCCFCSHKPIENCCVENVDCDDGNWCTADSCNAATDECIHAPIPNCCHADSDCDDGNPCNVGDCVNAMCRYTKDPNFGGSCCLVDEDCDDGTYCTVEYCNVDIHLCVYSLVPNSPPECHTAEHCDDGNPSTIDYCDGCVCYHKADASMCAADYPCTDNNPCTTDICVYPDYWPTGPEPFCEYEKIENCCLTDEDCEQPGLTDDNPNTVDTCDPETNTCVYTLMANPPCFDAVDCNDGKLCTADHCIAHACKYIATHPNCCETAQDCDDLNDCTADSCGPDNLCQHEVDVTNMDDYCCQDDADCNLYLINYPCHKPNCVNGACGFVPIMNCCSGEDQAVACNDNNPCTCDLCVFGECRNLPPEYLPAGVCDIPEDCCLDGLDCLPVPPCMTAWCDVTGKCQYDVDPDCALPLPYKENFNDCQALIGGSWSLVDAGGVATDNWKCVHIGPLGPDGHLRFDWKPVQGQPFDSFLVSPPLDASGLDAAVLQFQRVLAHTAGTLDLGVYVLKDKGQDGPTPDDDFVPLWTDSSADDDIPAERITFAVPKGHLTNHTYIAFQVKAGNSYQLDYYDLDNFSLCPGHAPEFTDQVPFASVAPGEEAEVGIGAQDADGDDLQLLLLSSPGFATLSASIFDPEEGEWTATLKVAPGPQQTPGTYVIPMRLTDGCAVRDTIATVHVAPNQGYIVWCPDPVPNEHCQAVEKGIIDSGRMAHIEHDLGTLPELEEFGGVFACLGVYGGKHVLTDAEAVILADYLDGGGKLYLEGGDTWAFDAWTELHPYFSVEPVSDGEPLLADLMFGRHFLYGVEVALGPDSTMNNYLDLIDREFGSDSTPLLALYDKSQFVTVAYEDEVLCYRTVATSVPFAGLLGDDAQPMLAKLLEFLETGWPPCVQGAQCNDSIQCSVDKCIDQVCENFFIPDCIQCRDDRDCPEHHACVMSNGICDMLCYTDVYLSKDTPIPFCGGAPCVTASTIAVPQSLSIDDVNVQVKIGHFRRGDLRLKLEHAQMSVLLAEPDPTDIGEGLFHTYDLGVDIPGDPGMGVFDGVGATGEWTLTIEDTSGWFPGALLEWRLYLNLGGTYCWGPPDCNDNNQCTIDNCVEWPGACGSYCEYLEDPCDDDDPCTIDKCNPIDGCLHEAVDCDDGDSCTQDWCDSGDGECRFDRVDNCDADCSSHCQCGLNDLCNPVTGACQPIPGSLFLPSGAFPASIPDGVQDGLVSLLSVGAGDTIADAVVKVDIVHPYRSDLSVTLVHDDVTLFLHQLEGGSANDLCRVYGTIPGTDPAFAPAGMYLFKGKAAGGQWVLTATDLVALDAGQLVDWRLFLSTD